MRAQEFALKPPYQGLCLYNANRKETRIVIFARNMPLGPDPQSYQNLSEYF